MELLVGIMLAGLIAAMGLLQTSRTTDSAETRGLAEELAEELRAARRQAITSRNPVAVAFPSGGGSSAHSQGFYLLRGPDHPRVVGGRRYQGDYPNACAFIGYWPVSATPNNSRTPIPFSGNDAGFDIVKWDVPAPQDYLFVFTPSGHLLTNGLASYAGEYHILISEGVTYAAAGPPPGSSGFPISYFTPSEVSSPYTICLSATGSVRVVPGVPGSSSLGGAHGKIGMPTAPPLLSPSSSNGLPVLLLSTPDPVPVNLPPGVDAVVPPRGYLSMRLEVNEPDGQLPNAFWECDGGTLSSLAPQAMEWDADRQVWYSVWVWTPPLGAVEGQQFKLNFEVDDGHGGVLTGNLGVSGKVRIGSPGLIAFTSARPNGYYEIATISPEGTHMKMLTSEGDEHENYYGSFSPGGAQLACYGTDYNDFDIYESLYVVNADGSNLRTIHDIDFDDDQSFWPGGYYSTTGPAWNDKGTRVAYAIGDDLDWSVSIWRANADGTGKLKLTNPPTDVSDYGPVWSSNGYIYFHRDRWTPGNCDIMRISAGGGSAENLTNAATDVYNYDPSCNPGGTKIVYVHDDWSSGDVNLRTMNADGSGKATILSSYWPTGPCFSPDGNLIAFVDGDLYVTTIDGKHPTTLAPGARALTGSGDVMEYAWSTDSTRLIFSDGYLLFQVKLSDGIVTRVSPTNTTEDWIPSWKP
jgi:type II secretory pathway pseudopilin PulG